MWHGDGTTYLSTDFTLMIPNTANYQMLLVEESRQVAQTGRDLLSPGHSEYVKAAGQPMRIVAVLCIWVRHPEPPASVLHTWRLPRWRSIHHQTPTANQFPGPRRRSRMFPHKLRPPIDACTGKRTQRWKSSTHEGGGQYICVNHRF